MKTDFLEGIKTSRCSNCQQPLMVGNNHYCLCPKCVEHLKAGGQVTVYQR